MGLSEDDPLVGFDSESCHRHPDDDAAFVSGTGATGDPCGGCCRALLQLNCDASLDGGCQGRPYVLHTEPAGTLAVTGNLDKMTATFISRFARGADASDSRAGGLSSHKPVLTIATLGRGTGVDSCAAVIAWGVIGEAGRPYEVWSTGSFRRLRSCSPQRQCLHPFEGTHMSVTSTRTHVLGPCSSRSQQCNCQRHCLC